MPNCVDSSGVTLFRSPTFVENLSVFFGIELFWHCLWCHMFDLYRLKMKNEIMYRSVLLFLMCFLWSVVDLDFLIVLHDSLFLVVMDVIIVCSSSGVILVSAIQVNMLCSLCILGSCFFLWRTRLMIKCPIAHLVLYHEIQWRISLDCCLQIPCCHQGRPWWIESWLVEDQEASAQHLPLGRCGWFWQRKVKGIFVSFNSNWEPVDDECPWWIRDIVPWQFWCQIEVKEENRLVQFFYVVEWLSNHGNTAWTKWGAAISYKGIAHLMTDITMIVLGTKCKLIRHS
jgi:hypothetical protein